MKFSRGEVWSINGVAYLATVLLVEHHEALGKIVHIGFLDPNVRLPRHMPFSKDAFERSVVRLMGFTGLGDTTSEGIEYWRGEVETHGAGVYGISVQDALTLTLK